LVVVVACDPDQLSAIRRRYAKPVTTSSPPFLPCFRVSAPSPKENRLTETIQNKALDGFPRSMLVSRGI
jgi:hypothetical protein